MSIRIAAISLLVVATLGLGLFSRADSFARPHVVEARADRGFAARCTFQRGQPGECQWRGRVRNFERDCRIDCFSHENANPGHKCEIESVE